MTTCSGRNASGFETQHPLLLLKAELEARKDTVSSKQVTRYSQSLGKPNLGQESLWANLEFQVMQIHWDKTPVPDLESSAMPCTIVKPCSLRNGDMQQRIGSPRADVRPNRIPGLLHLASHGDNWRQPALDGLVSQNVRWHPPSNVLQDRIAILYSWNAEDQRQRLVKCLDWEYRQHRQERRQEGSTGYPELSRASWGEI